MRVSLISTVLNEGDSLRGLLDSIAAQTHSPDDVIIVDGGSTDGTLAILDSYADRLPLSVLRLPGSNISQGRNAAIRAAPVEADQATQVVSGFFLPDPRTPFEAAMGATVLPALSDINPATFLPSSRSVAFRKSAWEAVGGYPEWLDFCEDLIFDFRLRDLFGPFVFAPDAIVYFRPRGSLRAFWRQYYQYARGDGKADLFLRRHLIRYLTYFGALPLIVAAALISSPWWLSLGVAGMAYMLAAPYRRLPGLWRDLSGAQKIAAALWVPIIRVSGDWAKMVGYPVGVLWRLRHARRCSA
jgi:glycosyltransferase involved in cell wall biosynthesis